LPTFSLAKLGFDPVGSLFVKLFFGDVLVWQKINNKYSVKEGFSKHFKKKDERVKIFCVENNRRNLNWQKFSNN
jgi:hypothetical protein